MENVLGKLDNNSFIKQQQEGLILFMQRVNELNKNLKDSLA